MADDEYGAPSPTDSPIEQFAAARRSRRDVVKWASLLPGIGLASALAACDDDDARPPVPTPTPTPTPTPSPSGSVSSFGLAVLPDTQFYSRYATAETGNQFNALYGSEPFRAQTDWLAKNAAALKIPFVVHVGDIVDQSGREQQWQVADAAMKLLEDAKLPYSVLAGNHDVLADVGYSAAAPNTGTEVDRKLADEPYLKWFGTERAKRNATFGGRDPSGFHEYHIFEAEGQKYLVLSLSWRVSQGGILWAQRVLNNNPTLPAILVNHELLAIANDAVSPQEVAYGLMLWDNLIRFNDQIFLTLNGHFHGSSTLVKTNDFGNPVIQMVVDYQMAYQGGNGLMRYLEFDLTNDKIRAVSFSPWVPQKPRATLNGFDQAVLTEKNNDFTIDLKFADRFKRFAPAFKAATPANQPLAAAAVLGVTRGFEPIAAPPVVNPAGPEDYPKIAGTTAHWRFFGGADGTPVPDRHVIADASGGNNPLTRAPLAFPAGNTAELADLTWSNDRHRLSSAPGSVVFRNAAGPRLSYFWTDVAAQMNDDLFETGYTVEAFIKIAADWTAARNAWMNIMTREGRRGSLAEWRGGLPQSPPLQFAISNLREVQWEATTRVAAPGELRARTAWSGEILVDRWLHVAIVNDPARRMTTMYVEGAPVLRNPIDTVGIASLDKRWVIGAGFWDDGPPGSGFLGAIGEIRIVPRPLAATDWLTARAR